MIERLLVVACVLVALYGVAAYVSGAIVERLAQCNAQEIARGAHVRAEVDL